MFCDVDDGQRDMGKAICEQMSFGNGLIDVSLYELIEKVNKVK